MDVLSAGVSQATESLTPDVTPLTSEVRNAKLCPFLAVYQSIERLRFPNSVQTFEQHQPLTTSSLQ